MRFAFTDTARPADAARELFAALCGKRIKTTYTACQDTIAQGCGWQDWRELKTAAGRLAPSALAEPGSLEAEGRVAALARAITGTGLNPAAADCLARKIELTVSRRAVNPVTAPTTAEALAALPVWPTGMAAPRSPEELIRSLPDFARLLGVELGRETKDGLEAMAAELALLQQAAGARDIDWNGLVAKAYSEVTDLAKAPMLSLLPKVPPEDVAVWVLEWLETERGWGQRPDGYSIHSSKSAFDVYLAEYWERMPKEVPDEYSRPCWKEPVRIVIAADHPLAADVAAGGGRIWHHRDEARMIENEIKRTAEENSDSAAYRR